MVKYQLVGGQTVGYFTSVTEDLNSRERGSTENKASWRSGGRGGRRGGGWGLKLETPDYIQR